LRPVAEFSDYRIGKGIENQCRHDDRTNDACIDSEHLIIEYQQEDRKTVVLNPISDRAEAVNHF